MKKFSIVRHLIAGSGVTVTIVQAEDKEQALKKYTEHLRMDCVPIGVVIEEITEDVCVVFEFDNPAYEG